MSEARLETLGDLLWLCERLKTEKAIMAPSSTEREGKKIRSKRSEEVLLKQKLGKNLEGQSLENTDR